MKVSVKKDVHNGIQPIRVLKHNITTRLVDRNEKYIEELLMNSKLDKKIEYHIAELPLSEKQTPSINEKGTISIHETFLSYIWIICYYFFVLYEETLVIRDAIRMGKRPKKHNRELCERAKELFDYGISLIKTYSDWDKEYLPNPEYYDKDDEEGKYIEKTNDLFVEVMNFILYHEIAHADLEHIKKRVENNLTNDDVKEIELGADRKAANQILSFKRSQIMTELSIVIGVASLIFFKNNLSGGKWHPDINIRLNNIINVFKPDDEHSLWAILCLVIKNWSNQFTLGLDEKGSYDNYKQLYDHLLSQVR